MRCSLFPRLCPNSVCRPLGENSGSIAALSLRLFKKDFHNHFSASRRATLSPSPLHGGDSSSVQERGCSQAPCVSAHREPAAASCPCSGRTDEPISHLLIQLPRPPFPRLDMCVPPCYHPQWQPINIEAVLRPSLVRSPLKARREKCIESGARRGEKMKTGNIAVAYRLFFRRALAAPPTAFADRLPSARATGAAKKQVREAV